MLTRLVAVAVLCLSSLIAHADTKPETAPVPTIEAPPQKQKHGAPCMVGTLHCNQQDPRPAKLCRAGTDKCEQSGELVKVPTKK